MTNVGSNNCRDQGDYIPVAENGLIREAIMPRRYALGLKVHFSPLLAAHK
jgi:hypothetical protein